MSGKCGRRLIGKWGSATRNKKKLAARYVTASEITTSAVLASLDLAAGDIQPVSPNASGLSTSFTRSEAGVPTVARRDRLRDLIKHRPQFAGIDAIGAHQSFDQRIGEHIVECWLVVAPSHSVLLCFTKSGRNRRGAAIALRMQLRGGGGDRLLGRVRAVCGALDLEYFDIVHAEEAEH